MWHLVLKIVCREAASLLEVEKEQILDMLNKVQVNTDLFRLGQGDREDINATTNRLSARTKAVEVRFCLYYEHFAKSIDQNFYRRCFS